LAAAGLAACSGGPTARPATTPSPERTVILVSLDGFRADYFPRTPSPTLHRLAARGVRAERMIPSFPSKTFPNHFAIVTGKRPEHNGIVANDILDPRTGARFTLSDRAAVTDARWWLAEPVWVSAERRGIATAPYFWPGAEAPIGGVRPTYGVRFDERVSAEERVERAVRLLEMPTGRRPRFITVYLQNVDDAGHTFGPETLETGAAVGRVDAALATLVAALDREGLTASTDLIVLADHGMAQTRLGDAIYLDDLVDLDRVSPWISSWSPVLGITPPPSEIESTFRALDRGGHLKVYRREELPERFHYRDSDRIPPIFAIADEGYRITRHGAKQWSLGEHGYDPELPSMGALFIAAGPDFRNGVVVPPFPNVEVYPLLCRALGIEPLPGDWTLDDLPAVWRGASPPA
jgi:predicted AlkP superfamily pyrophosphatase or phosphodiesterase